MLARTVLIFACFSVVALISGKNIPVNDEGKPIYMLAKDESCAQDVKKLCPKVKKENNFAVFVCLQDAARRDEDDVSDECQETLWHYKFNLTQDARFDEAAIKVCLSSIEKLKDECSGAIAKPGFLMNCLVENRHHVEDQKCQSFLNKMAAIVFSDYRLIYGFYEDCAADIKKTSCGILSQSSDPKGTETHEQSEVIGCLEASIDEVSEKCQSRLLHLAELQADDYHLDRPLYYACQEVRVKFCADVKSGEGKIYKCLLSHVNDNEMPEECAAKLRTREKLMSKDVKINYALWKSCEPEYKKYQCAEQLNRKQLSEVGEGAALLLCLQAEVAKGSKVSQKCQSEMRIFALMVFENYQISPVIAAHCDAEISRHCSHVERNSDDGDMMDCLMTQAAANNSLSKRCFQAVAEVLKETGAGNSYKVDRALYKSCESVITTLCKEKDDMMVLSCLMDNVNSNQMPHDCSTQVFHLQYFLSRDFRLDTSLYRDCHKDAEEICHASNFKDRSETKDNLPDNFVIACLYRNSIFKDGDKQVSKVCATHVQRVMHKRGEDVKLHPEIEFQCLKDLGKHCLDQNEENQEVQCLQEHYDELDAKCKKAISEFTQLEAKDFDLDKHLVDKCATMVTQFCKRELEDGEGEEVLPCLVKHKNDIGMDHECASAVEHWQLLEMKDFNFSPMLKDMCLEDVRKLCKKSTSKFDAVKCLSEQIVRDHKSVSQKCRAQVKKELMVQGENIKLNPLLYKACKQDIDTFCRDVPSYGAQLEECLRRHRQALQNKECKKYLYEQELSESKDTELDYRLLRQCESDIHQFCANHDIEDMMSCLRNFIHNPGMSKDCRNVLSERQVEEAESFELDAELSQNCETDVRKHCGKIFSEAKGPGDNGRIFGCLSDVLLQNDELLPECEQFVRKREREAALTSVLNPQFLYQCRDEIDKLCRDLSQNNVIDCMKIHLPQIMSSGCKEEVKKLVKEGFEDAYVDPHLQEICARDIRTYCGNMPERHGSIVLCLIDVHKAKNLHLHQECDNFLRKRLDLYNAANIKGFESFSAVMAAVAASPNRNYIYTTLLVILSILFIVGILCGRFTKRITAQMKNR